MDEAKNMALLFFLDHLMQKNGRRTIHDLSCQFGARGFTQEMRDAVGTTQEGLTEFLEQHPSLFTVENDQVILKGFGETDGKNHLMKIPPNGRQRDYEAEAVEFFVAKLEKFGPELQIKSLLGHRSQAAPEVRLISGRHLKDFCEFLQMQTEYFIVEGDRVRLKNMPEPSEELNELDDEGKPLTGIKAKQAAVDFLKSILEQNEDTPIPLDTFYRRFCERFPHSVRQEVATNPKELLQFLKLNRNIFFIRSNKVSLVKSRPGEESGNGSESGRSTASGESNSVGGGRLTSMNGGENNNILFPLNHDNLHRINFVKSLKMAQDVVSNLFNDLDSYSGDKYVTVDFKLVTLGGVNCEEFLSMIVLASTSRIAIFDLVHSDSILMESGLKELLETNSVLKVIHDVKSVATLLAQRYGVNMRNVFDTQLAHAVIQHEKFNKSINELRGISFVNLQRVYYPQSLMLSDVTPRKLSQTPDWSYRPISNEFILNVAEECHCLMTALYRLLCLQLPDVHRKVFEEKCLEALVPLPTKPPPQLNNSLHISSATANGLTTMSLVENTPFNGIYRPPATRRRVLCPTGQLYSTTNNLPIALRKASEPLMGLKHTSIQLPVPPKPKMVDSCTQTISTGEITALNIYFENS